ncbi:MAG: pyridoxamine 5'-phosphate oxidase family protein [Desulfocucumaceae bacterium]
MLLSERQLTMLHNLTTVKFLATADEKGRVNVAPILTTDFFRDDLLVFGEFIMWKTKENLLKNNKVAILVVDENLEHFSVEGTFTGFETKGEAFEWVNDSPMFKYNAYTGVRSAGVIRMNSVSANSAVSKLRIIRELIPGALSGNKMSINRVVGEKFLRLKALKALTFLREGRPVVVPVPVISIDGDVMVFRNSQCPSGVFAAMTVITMEPVTYQVKGSLTREGGLCRLRVEEIYTGGIPVPGKRIS